MGFKKSPAKFMILIALISCGTGIQAAQAGTAEDCQRLRSLASQANWAFAGQIANAILMGIAANQKNGSTNVAVGALGHGAATQAAMLIEQETRAIANRLGISNRDSRKSVCGF